MKIYQKITLLIIISVFIECNKKKESLSEYHKLTPSDSLNIKNENIEPEEFEGDDTRKIREEYISNYNKIENIDSTLVDNDGNKIHFISKYYCLFDKSLIIPKMYVWEDSSSDFITHNYANDITITINEDTIFKKTILKEDFKKILDKSLRNYAVIMSPSFEYNKNNIKISYSISIPITDLGIGANFIIERNGTYKISAI
ncbi:hypothetical protein CWI39_3672p0010 [Hamiltosporidium magnivora]|uniref:Uncharacterized protein n=1 Tax=Hamiltosporidium magnivora TaxID=148818 RepID=A0A4Q9KRE9_9MICR|nr:hypothetical protein CWI39_3672p0010 [Hamiltosporidium magnivora]